MRVVSYSLLTSWVILVAMLLFETGSTVVQSSQWTCYVSKNDLASRSACLHLPSVGITCVCHHAQPHGKLCPVELAQQLKCLLHKQKDQSSNIQNSKIPGAHGDRPKLPASKGAEGPQRNLAGATHGITSPGANWETSRKEQHVCQMSTPNIHLQLPHTGVHTWAWAFAHTHRHKE